MKTKLAVIVLIMLVVSAITTASPHKHNSTPSPVFTVKPVFDGTAELVNCVTATPATVLLFLDDPLMQNPPSATQTTTIKDLQASFTVNQNADGSFPVITVAVQ